MKKNTTLHQVNEKLDKEFGHNKVKLLQRNDARYPFVLRFEEDNPPQWQIDRAEKIVSKAGIFLFMDGARVVK